MVRHTKLYIGRKLFDLPHPFVEEVNWLVRTNYDLLCKAISGTEQEEVMAAERLGDLNDVGDAIVDAKSSADELRGEARGLTLVSLVTRFQHWLRVFVDELNKKVANGVVPNMQSLNETLGKEGPVPIAFFQDLETVRDSIIHADSNVEWMRGKEMRRVPQKYRGPDLEALEKLKLPEEMLREIRENAMARINLTDQHLEEAISKSVEQIEWYDAQLENWTGDESAGQ